MKILATVFVAILALTVGATVCRRDPALDAVRELICKGSRE
ncbi:MAG TPA: hypothetical protein VGC87_25540 [Pyrinomonadaceae bacterium]|jgi:hypothetical protein